MPSESEPNVQRPSRTRSVLAFVVSGLLTFAIAYGVVFGVRWIMRPATPAAVQPWRPALTSTVPAALDVYLMHAGNRYSPSQTIALPSGSQFHLDLKATVSGRVTLQAINPAGESSQVWVGELLAGHAVSTPGLKLQGQRGTERLRVVFAPAAQPGMVVVEQMTVLHQ